MNKVAVVIGLLVLALSLQGKNRTETVKAENYGLNISGYSKESLSEVAREATILEKVEFMPSAELSQK
ncbi:hypothetical protein I6E17_01695 [Fusobacterium perfoetens]|uniref:hypothetical protein n=1 Tax=Fusobacterium perfoetens TaxID=852 RepID=UPI001F254E54|nr:hypothetical protein [Fusobacterium perfoetens]MCF2624889.1 hypothetical protein [Fusobacterium perfoetens]